MNHMPQYSIKELHILMPGTNPAALPATVLGTNRNNIFLAFFSLAEIMSKKCYSVGIF